MRAIYEPKGRAREYAALACNLFTGCPHGCVYCYAPALLRRSRAEFRRDVWHRPGILEALERDCKRLAEARCRDEVLLCFSCDPWPPGIGLQNVTLRALHIIGSAGLRVSTLTKGCPLDCGSVRNCNQFAYRYGISLSFLSDDLHRRWEPGSATAECRLAYLRRAKENWGLETWVSVEPVIDAEEALRAIESAAPWADKFRLGKLNHMAAVEQGIDWRGYAERAVALCERLGKRYFVKSDLAAYLDPR